MDVILAILLGLILPPILFACICGVLMFITAIVGAWHDR